MAQIQSCPSRANKSSFYVFLCLRETYPRLRGVTDGVLSSAWLDESALRIYFNASFMLHMNEASFDAKILVILDSLPRGKAKKQT